MKTFLAITAPWRPLLLGGAVARRSSAPRARQRVRRPRVPDIGSVSPETEPTHGGGAVPASCSGAPTTVKHRERTVAAACARRACVAGVVSITSITRATARVIHAPTRSAPLLPCTRRPLRKTGYERSGALFSQRWSYEPGLDGRDACLAPLNMLCASYPGPRTPPRPGTVERASPPQPTSTPRAQPTRISHSAHALPTCTAHVRGPRASHPSVDSRSTRLGRKLTWRRGAPA